jgi:hypothetical protein
VLPAGRSDNGDELYWVTGAAPDDWPLALVEARAASHELHRTTVTGFLAALADGTLRSRILPPEVLERDEHVFEPFG